MAQWSRADRTLFTKIVYYGPAFGGKTTNLESLHRLTDPDNKNQLLTIKTASDRTLFFDLLPFDLGEFLGYQVGMKLYTVPGQVRYETTRQVVLAGADALVFVADSSQGRAEQNRWSLQNLKMNMRAKRLDPSRVPVLFQFNKQDLPDAADPETVADWLGIPASKGIPAVATEGEGVLETFVAASRAMLSRLILMADEKTRRGIDQEQLNEHVDRAFAPYLQRAASGLDPDASQDPVEENTLPIVLDNEDLLQDSIQANVTLAEKLAVATQRARRLEGEAEALRRLTAALRSVDQAFDAGQVVDAVLTGAMETLHAEVVSLMRSENGTLVSERVLGRPAEPLAGFPEGAGLLLEMAQQGEDRSVRLSERLGLSAPESTRGLQAVAVAPIGGDASRLLAAYAGEPDGHFRPEDERFLSTLAGHLEVGLEKAALYTELSASNERLETQVQQRTRDLMQAYEDLRQLDELKDRFLSNVSHEMKTPLTGILSSAVFLRDYKKSKGKERDEMVSTIVSSAETLEQLLDNLFRLVRLEKLDLKLTYETTDAVDVVREAIELCGHAKSHFRARGKSREMTADRGRLARAIANLCDNAVKFSGETPEVEIIVEPDQIMWDGERRAGMAFTVLDRGKGVDPADRARIFQPLEQGSDLLTDKPHGVGLGLHEAKTIAERHGGGIEYCPREGGGSEFRIVVPIERVDAEDEENLSR